VTGLEVLALCVLAGLAASFVERLRLAKFVARADARRAAAEASADQLRVQLANCGTAARGVGEPKDRASYGWSPAYQDVVDLRREVLARRVACEEAIDHLDDWDPTVPNGRGPIGKAKAALVAVRDARAFGPLQTARRFRTVEDVIDHLKRAPEGEEPE